MWMKGTPEHLQEKIIEVGFQANQGGTAGLQSRPCNVELRGRGFFVI